ncbi:phage tail-collar fiber domain-containing protein [Acinetobacter ursingii]|uniref:phage tail-collar fiber domain-containing protein n=1 Tax=Acinetobacter ursingii TaxID=108980 RepID=UPI0012505B20|nr:phage tail protein [Acinetobacter ursingii]
MAEQIYYSVFTKKGLELLTEAILNGTKLGITSMAFGDGGGSLPVPNENFTSMVREVHRTQLNSLAPDPNNANWLRAEAIIASAVGGFNIRELGLYAGNVLVAYSNYPATYKPNPSDGTARIMTFRMILQIDNTANFDLVIDPDVVLVTIQLLKTTIIKSVGVSITDFNGIADYKNGTGTNNFSALKEAIAYATTIGKRVVKIPAGDWYFEIDETDSIDLGSPNKGVSIQGDGRECTKIYFKAKNQEDKFFTIVSGSAWESNRNISDLSVYGTSDNNNKGIILYKNGCCFSVIEKFHFSGAHIGVCYENGIGNGTFSEFNILKDGRLSNNNINRLYRVNGGDESFHGNDIINVQNQIKENGIGIKVEGITKPCYLYNQMWLEHFFGGDNCFAFDLINCNTDNIWGNLTREGNVICKSDASSIFEFNGNFSGIHTLSYQIESEETSRLGRFVFDDSVSNNGSFIQSSLAGYSPILMKKPQVNFNNGANSYIYSIRPSESGAGLGTGLNAYSWSIGWLFTTTAYKENLQYAVPKYRLSADGNYFKAYSSDFTIDTNGIGIILSTSENALKPRQAISLGTANNRFSAALLTYFDIKQNIIPNIPFTSNLGSSSNPLSDCYLKNAVTVVSDERFKTDISELTQQEINCAKACSRIYRKYKLNHSVNYKGSDARYHFGAIAQEIVQCFTDHDLDWKQYGIITYEKWDSIAEVKYQAATYDENGQELTPGISAVEGREAGEIYMMRYEEFNCFVNAGMEAILSELENRISKLENDSIS